MKLVSFLIKTPVGTFTRLGSMHGESIVDLNMAYARWLHDQREAQPYRLANAQVPSTMLEFLEGGATAMAAAQRAFDYVVTIGATSHGPSGDTVLYRTCHVTTNAPLPNPPSFPDSPAFATHTAAPW